MRCAVLGLGCCVCTCSARRSIRIISPLTLNERCISKLARFASHFSALPAAATAAAPAPWLAFALPCRSSSNVALPRWSSAASNPNKEVTSCAVQPRSDSAVQVVRKAERSSTDRPSL